MLETLVYVDENGLKCPLRVRRKEGNVWFHLRDLKVCLGILKKPVMFQAVNVRKFLDETHVNVQGVKLLLDACANLPESWHFIKWFKVEVLAERLSD